jgi:hypothetical protein
MLKHPDLDSAAYGATLASINQSVHKGLLVVLVIVVLTLLWEIGKFSLFSYRRRVVAHS